MNKKILLFLGLVFATLIVFKIEKRENANASKCGDKAEYKAAYHVIHEQDSCLMEPIIQFQFCKLAGSSSCQIGIA